MMRAFLILALISGLASAGEMKKVCNEKKVCKTIKVHKKLDATKIPGK